MKFNSVWLALDVAQRFLARVRISGGKEQDMKKLVGIAVFAAALMVGAVAQAAAINIIAHQVAPGSNTWELSIDTSSLPVAAIGIVAPDTATFAINTANTAIASIGGGSSFGDSGEAGLFSLNLNPSTCAGVNCTPFVSNGVAVLGTFTAAGPGFSIGPDNGAVGGTAFDSVLNVYADNLISVETHPFVPEPTATLLVGIGLATLGLVRRKAA
jgi:hypothetical protein